MKKCGDWGEHNASVNKKKTFPAEKKNGKKDEKDMEEMELLLADDEVIERVSH